MRESDEEFISQENLSDSNDYLEVNFKESDIVSVNYEVGFDTAKSERSCSSTIPLVTPRGPCNIVRGSCRSIR